MIRDSPAGQFIRWATGARYLKYPEELSNFELPALWNAALNASEIPHAHLARGDSISSPEAAAPPHDLEKEVTITSPHNHGSESSASNLSVKLTRIKSRAETTPWSQERYEIEEELAVEKTISKPIIPLKTSDGIVCIFSFVVSLKVNLALGSGRLV
jgi:DHA1 family multidrug resistance protein-like MFS transporter